MFLSKMGITLCSTGIRKRGKKNKECSDLFKCGYDFSLVSPGSRVNSIYVESGLSHTISTLYKESFLNMTEIDCSLSGERVTGTEDVLHDENKRQISISIILVYLYWLQFTEANI